MDKSKIEFLDLKRQTKSPKNPFLDESKAKNTTNPIMGAFLEFKQSKKFTKFNIEDL